MMRRRRKRSPGLLLSHRTTIASNHSPFINRREALYDGEEEDYDDDDDDYEEEEGAYLSDEDAGLDGSEPEPLSLNTGMQKAIYLSVGQGTLDSELWFH